MQNKTFRKYCIDFLCVKIYDIGGKLIEQIDETFPVDQEPLYVYWSFIIDTWLNSWVQNNSSRAGDPKLLRGIYNRDDFSSKSDNHPQTINAHCQKTTCSDHRFIFELHHYAVSQLVYRADYGLRTTPFSRDHPFRFGSNRSKCHCLDCTAGRRYIHKSGNHRRDDAAFYFPHSALDVTPEWDKPYNKHSNHASTDHHFVLDPNVIWNISALVSKQTVEHIFENDTRYYSYLQRSVGIWDKQHQYAPYS